MSLDSIYDFQDKQNIFDDFTNIKYIFTLKDDSFISILPNILEYLPKENIQFDCLITNTAEIPKYEKLEKLNLNYNLVPIYNNNNLSFFENNIFIDKDDIVSLKPNQNEVFKNKTMSTKNWGKLYVNNNGNIYANLNRSKLGNISTHSIAGVTSKELRNKESWLLPRNSVEPCNKCVFNILCPSISNYEFVIKKFNLCNIFQ